MRPDQIIKKPILTEKTYKQMEFGSYTFKVDKNANKFDIKNAIEFIWKVDVKKVNIVNTNKKPKKVGRFSGFVSAYKKAIVTLSSGAINFFPNESVDVKEKPAKTKVVDVAKQEKSKLIESKIAAKLASKKASDDKHATKIKNDQPDNKTKKSTATKTKTNSKKTIGKSTTKKSSKQE